MTEKTNTQSPYQAAADLKSYERLLGRPPDVIVKDDEAMWKVKDTGWIYVVTDAQRAGNAFFENLGTGD